MDLHEWTSVGQALARAAVAGVVIWEARRFGTRQPRLLVLAAGFLVVNAFASLNETGVLGFSSTAAALLDTISVVLLVLFLVKARNAARAIELLVDEARYRRHEYERARADFATLVRHRVFNPLTVIRGGAETLRARPADERTTAAVLEAILEATKELESLTLDVENGSAEEHSLRVRPRLRRRRETATSPE